MMDNIYYQYTLVVSFVAHDEREWNGVSSSSGCPRPQHATCGFRLPMPGASPSSTVCFCFLSFHVDPCFVTHCSLSSYRTMFCALSRTPQAYRDMHIGGVDPMRPRRATTCSLLCHGAARDSDLSGVVLLLFVDLTYFCFQSELFTHGDQLSETGLCCDRTRSRVPVSFGAAEKIPAVLNGGNSELCVWTDTVMGTFGLYYYCCGVVNLDSCDYQEDLTPSSFFSRFFVICCEPEHPTFVRSYVLTARWE